MRSLPVLALAAVLLATGCAALSGSPPEPPTVTPAPVPENSPTPFGPPARLAPGVTSDGIVEPEAVVAAHRRALSNQSYTAVVATTVVSAGRPNRTANGSAFNETSGALLVASREVRRVGAGGVPVSLIRAVEGPLARPVPVVPGGERGAVAPPVTVATWTNDTVGYRRVSGDGRVAHARVPQEATVAGETPPPSVLARALFEAVPTRVATSAHPGGLVQVSGYASRLDADVAYPLADRVAAPQQLRLEAEVAPSGLILELEVRYRGTLEGRPVAVEYAVDRRDLGTTAVGRPVWVAGVANESR